ncbi:hypothetical protein [Acinetobacter sp. MD2(2019)]|uniref:hypothetical protein n=1 Tax=Acinetobacter sp. MD2(2019) TaxID=2605273 RepID=UPI002D1E6029|nr:hypothetical protein [Acinetobacter sp. MD2(2019)]MEB3752980.1 hypothetical protein [Acinetobacter sp. MD2(2019)]
MVWNVLRKPKLQLSKGIQLTWVPNPHYSILHWNFILLNLPEPFHFLNVQILIGTPNIPIFKTNHVKTTTSDSFKILIATSAQHSDGLQNLSIQDDCELKERLLICLNHVLLEQTGTQLIFDSLQREITLEFSFQLSSAMHKMHTFNAGLYQKWQIWGELEGELNYKQNKYALSAPAVLYYSKMMDFPFVHCYFYFFSMIEHDSKTYTFIQIRNQFNQIMQSKLMVSTAGKTEEFTQNVVLTVLRVYPKIKSKNGAEMYLPREFVWRYADKTQQINVYAHARGDFKAGVGNEFVGSFQYTCIINNQEQQGKSGFCIYADCRALKWQEKNESKRLKSLQNAPEFVCSKAKIIKKP